jgi:hypothetical protein
MAEAARPPLLRPRSPSLMEPAVVDLTSSSVSAPFATAASQSFAGREPRKRSAVGAPWQSTPDLTIGCPSLTIAASSVALVTGLHTYSDSLLSTFIEHVYQGRQDQLQHDCAVCGLELVSQEEQVGW